MNRSTSVFAPSAPTSSVSTIDERPRPGNIPLWEIPGWGERFGVVAGITGRGSDPGSPFDLGLWGSGAVGTSMSRWGKFLAAFPEFPTAILAHQIHGTRVLWHDRPMPGWTIIQGADGHATRAPGQLLLVTVADCVPVYLVAPRQRAVALLHAGWRGTAAGILAEGAKLLANQTGATPDELVGHAGVAISGPCYEVGAEVMAGVGKPAEGPGPWHLDLRSVLKEQAEAIGVKGFTSSTHCTSRDQERFFSHRGSGGKDGRMVAYLGLKTEGP